MPKDNKVDNKKELPVKWDKILKKMPDWKDAAESKSSEELQREILKAQGVIADLEAEIENDDKLRALREELKDLMGGFRDAMGREGAKSAYCVHLLRQRGGF